MQNEGQFAAALIQSGRKAHAAGVTLRMRERGPGFVDDPVLQSFGPAALRNEEMLEYLAVALSVARPILFHDHVRWLKCAFVARSAPLEALRETLSCLRDELGDGLPDAAARTAVACVEGALQDFERAPDCVENPLDGNGPQVDLARRYLLAVLEGRRENAIDLSIGALQQGLSVSELYTEVLGATQIEIGLMWQRGEIHIGEEHFASRITEQVMAIVNAKMQRAPHNGKRVLVTSASGDLHDIGVRMVADHFEMDGFEALYLGASTPPDDLARAVRDFEVDLVALAAKQALHLPATIEMIAAVREAPLGKRPPILVGGAPFTLVPDLWQVVGADAMARSAREAVEVGRRLTR